MKQILLAYGIPKETIAAITILYRNTKVKVRCPVGDTDYFDIVAGVLQGDTLDPYFFIICLDYVLRASIDKIKENGFLTKKKKQKIPRKNNYLRRWHSNSYKYTYPNWKNYCILWNEPPLALASMSMHTKRNTCALIKLVTFPHEAVALWNKFTYLGNSVSSTEKYIDMRLTKAWTAMDKLLVIWKSDLTDKMKHSFFQAAVVSILLYGCTTCIPNLQTPILGHGAKYTNYGISLPQLCPPPFNLSATMRGKNRSKVPSRKVTIHCPTLWFFKSKVDGYVWKEEGLLAAEDWTPKGTYIAEQKKITPISAVDNKKKDFIKLQSYRWRQKSAGVTYNGLRRQLDEG